MTITLLSGRIFTTQGISDAVSAGTPTTTTISANASASGTSSTGNATVTTSGPYVIHTFTSSGTFTANATGLIEYFLVAGGGGAGKPYNSGGDAGGSGGGGGILYWQDGVTAGAFQVGSAFRVYTGDVVTVTIGAGGAAATSLATYGGNGTPTSLSISSIGQYIPTIGGGGGGYSATYGSTYYYPGFSGGCAGGGGRSTTDYTFGANIFYPRQGNDAQGFHGGGGGAASVWNTSASPYVVKPGYPLRTTFGGNLISVAAGGRYGVNADAPSNSGDGGQSGTAPGNGSVSTVYSGGSGIAIIRYLTNTNVIVSNVAVLLVGGGAGGSSQSGGGAGGLVYYGTESPKTPNGSAISFYAGTYTVLVGAGGSSTQPTAGGSSSIYSVPGAINGVLIAYGGGGRTSNYSADWDGGSGSGEASPGQGRGTIGQGNNGGTTATRGGGGGGGAGAAGTNAAYDVGGNGGAGLQYSISGTATYYSGGGGGAAYTGTAGTGGTGGGGAGTSGFTYGNNGTANTGGGGGSGWSGSGTGGSGIVILKYPDSYPAATATTGSPTITVSGGYRVYKFTSSGTITFA